MKKILASVFIFSILAISAGDFEILNRDGKPLSAAEKKLFKLETAPGKNYRYKLTSLSDKPQFYRIRFSIRFKGEHLTVFDGFKSFSLKKDHYRKRLLDLGGLPLCAVWTNDTGTALAAGAEDLHTIMWGEIRRTGSNIRLILEVNGALLHKDAVYSGVWHEIKFSPKYGERDALAGYYALYPQCFKRNPAVDPRVGGSSCQYASWNSADPEVCRVMTSLNISSKSSRKIPFGLKHSRRMFSFAVAAGSISSRYRGMPPVTESTSIISRLSMRCAALPQNLTHSEIGSSGTTTSNDRRP